MPFPSLSFHTQYDPVDAAFAAARLQRAISTSRRAREVDPVDELYTAAADGKQGEIRPLYDTSVYCSSFEQLAGMLEENTSVKMDW